MLVYIFSCSYQLSWASGKAEFQTLISHFSLQWALEKHILYNTYIGISFHQNYPDTCMQTRDYSARKYLCSDMD